MNELSPREKEVLDLAGDGMTNKEIARKLFISIHTVSQHLANSYIKLGAKNKPNAVKKSYESTSNFVG